MERIVRKSKVIVGMSGGVDSSVAAFLLKEQGYDVLGVFMQNWEEDNTDTYCSIKEDAIDAIAVADKLGIDIELVNFAAEYKDRVFQYFLKEYSAGRTPNPDVLCNSEIKFKAFLEYALAQGAEKIATGHYARLIADDKETALYKAVDKSKDQSYFLYRLNQHQLSHALFPLGDLLKSDVRVLAEKIGLPNARKKDSTGICFIGERPFREFLNRYLPKAPGIMQTPEGKQVGEHMGLMYYTLGQRQGLGIGGAGAPWFVADKNVADNTLIVVQGHDHPLLLKSYLTAMDLSWTSAAPPQAGCYTAKTRYRQQEAPCQLCWSHEAIELSFTESQWAITPGQSAVLYEQERCWGGGIIC
jgi:tRNA-specific 2-thiouridylase